MDRLRAAGRETRVLSRRAGPGRTLGDLRTGAGLDAVRGTTVIVHCATALRHDAKSTQTSIDVGFVAANTVVPILLATLVLLGLRRWGPRA